MSSASNPRRRTRRQSAYVGERRRNRAERRAAYLSRSESVRQSRIEQRESQETRLLLCVILPIAVLCTLHVLLATRWYTLLLFAVIFAALFHGEPLLERQLRNWLERRATCRADSKERHASRRPRNQ